MAKVFISYSWKDKAFARKLAEELGKAGVDVWIDEEGLRIGDSLLDKISAAIEEVDYMAVILSSTSVLSPWVEHELKLAMSREIADRKVIVLPVLIEKCEVPSYLVNKAYANFTDPDLFEETFNRFLKTISENAAATYKERTSIPRPTSSRRPPRDFPQKIAIRVTKRALEDFEDIRISDVDKDRAYRPDENKLLYNVYFRLSAMPPQEWIDIFIAERKFPRHTMWRKAWIENEYIIVHCGLDEVKQYHFADLQEDVRNSNTKYRDYLLEQAGIASADLLRKAKEMDDIDNALGGLEFN